jgi:hypothetical protein
MIVECELEECVHCGEQLVPSETWHMRKAVQTMEGRLFVAGKSKKCDCADCSHYGHHYHASGVLRVSLPHSTYGLDVLAFIGWQHEHEHKQLVEIQEMLNEGGIEVCERHVGRLYRQFLALLGGMNERVKFFTQMVRITAYDPRWMDAGYLQVENLIPQSTMQYVRGLDGRMVLQTA